MNFVTYFVYHKRRSPGRPTRVGAKPERITLIRAAAITRVKTTRVTFYYSSIVSFYFRFQI